MKTILSALIVLSAPAMLLANTPKAHTPASGVANAEKAVNAATTWTGELSGVTTANQEMVKTAIAKIPGVKSVSIDAATGKTSISGESFTPAQVASALPTGVTIGAKK